MLIKKSKIETNQCNRYTTKIIVIKELFQASQSFISSIGYSLNQAVHADQKNTQFAWIGLAVSYNYTFFIERPETPHIIGCYTF